MYKIKFIIITSVFFACTLPLLAQSSDNWKGFYAGGNGFIPNDKSDASATLNINQISGLFVANRGIIIVPGTTRDFTASQRTTSGGGGGQAGYQWQAGRFVFGGEGDFNPFHRTASVSQSQQIPVTALTPVVTINSRRDVQIRQELSLRGRGGVAFGKTFIYGTGGYSFARTQAASIDSYTNPGGPAALNTINGVTTSVGQANLGPEGPVVTTSTGNKQNMNGWNVGGGFDYKLSKRLSVGFEYRHTDLRSKTFTLSSQTTINTGPETKGDAGGLNGSGLGVTGLVGNVSTGPTSISLKSDSFGVRVNFHF